MGKAVPKGIKSKANTLVKLYKDKFSADFEKNKKFIDSLSLPLPKLTRNLLAGFITKIYKKETA